MYKECYCLCLVGIELIEISFDYFFVQIYVTEVTARIGQLLMEDLVLMNKEFRQFYGCEESGLPQWMNWEKLESLPSLFREIVLGEDGVELGGWMPLYR